MNIIKWWVELNVVCNYLSQSDIRLYSWRSEHAKHTAKHAAKHNVNKQQTFVFEISCNFEVNSYAVSHQLMG